MSKKNIEELLAKARHEGLQLTELPEQPMRPGFTERVMTSLKSERWDPLILTQKLGYLGVAAAVILTTALHFTKADKTETLNAADPWMDFTEQAEH